MNNSVLKIKILFISITLILIMASCGSLDITSKWRTQKIAIDGINSEWKNGTLIKDAKAVINFYNDNEYLYLCIISADKDLQNKILRSGLTIWFDAGANNEKYFGIHYPVGFAPGEMTNMPQPGSMDMEINILPQMNGLNEMEIIGESGQVLKQISAENNSEGILAKMGRPDEKFFYELKIPFVQSGAITYSVNADTNKIISVGFETAEDNFEKMKPPMDDSNKPDMPGGGVPPSGGGGMPGGGNMPSMGKPGGGLDKSKSLDLWINLKLSSSK
ncbi:MAG: hypothetical protein V1720_05830 [bacterium]